MRYLALHIVIIFLVSGLLACTNNRKVSDAVAIKPVAKTIIIDVRTVEEWNNDGHANCTVNYPLDQLDKQMDALKKYDTVLVVCRSGKRAEVAKGLLEQAGVKHVENKGGWQQISCGQHISTN